MIIAKTNFPISDVQNRILRNRFMNGPKRTLSILFSGHNYAKTPFSLVLERVLETLNWTQLYLNYSFQYILKLMKLIQWQLLERS